HGDTQIMLYQASKHASVPLLPDVHGDQFLVGAPPDHEYLIENFVADDPVKAQQVPLTQVAGTLQLWYVKRDEQPKLVYSQKRTSEEMFVPLDSVLMTSSYPYPDPMNTTLLLYPYFDEETKTGLAFDWKTQTASEITVDEHAAKEKKISSNGGK
ncbi:MAG: hypothetical protein ACXVC5_09315, partial [Tumebacillaceae bacterium]